MASIRLEGVAFAYSDAVAVLDSLEIYWPVSVMRQLMTRFPQIAMQSAAAAGTRLFEMQNRVGEASGERVEQRIARAVSSRRKVSYCASDRAPLAWAERA